MTDKQLLNMTIRDLSRLAQLNGMVLGMQIMTKPAEPDTEPEGTEENGEVKDEGVNQNTTAI